MGGGSKKIELDISTEIDLSAYNRGKFTIPKDGIVTVCAQWNPGCYAYVMVDGSKHRYLSVASPYTANGTSETEASAPVYEGMVLYVEIGKDSQAWFTPFK